MSEAEDVLAVAAGWLAAGETVALATVVETWGSSPRPRGSRMAMTAEGRMAGSVSGGCVEGAVIEAAGATLASGTPQVLEFGVSDQQAWDVGWRAARAVRVRGADRVTPGMLEALLAATQAGRAVVLATRLADGTQRLLPDEVSPDGIADAAALALARDESRLVEAGGERWFLQVQAPPHRLIVVGAVHLAQALVAQAAGLDFAVTIVDPRGTYATEERFPGVTLSRSWPDEALDEAGLDGRCAVVALCHDPKLDDPALDRALRSAAFYIGALGSRKSQAARLKRLAALGHDPASLARIRGPVGLALGAVTTGEIALSILAELVAARRGAAIARRG